MRPDSPHFFPLALPFVLALLMLLVLVVAFLEVGLISYAYEKIGVGRRWASLLLVLSLLGSYVNIPVGELPPEPIVAGGETDFFGMRYVIPPVEGWRATIVAVNLGGAVIPVLLSGYLLVRSGLWLPGLAGAAIVTAIAHALAYRVPGVGIALPALVPPIAAAVVALLLSPRAAPPVAYVAGTLGTLIGADLMNLGQLQGLGAPVASIGGAGTFDGIFLTGIIAVLLA